MRTRFLHAIVLCAAAFSLPGVARTQPIGAADRGGRARVAVVSKNLHRVKVLLEGDARAVWIGDSWCKLNRVDRLPYGALATWAFDDVTAVCLGYKGGGGIGRATNYTSGPGALVEINASNSWIVEVNDGQPAYFGLPVADMTKVFGEADLQLTGSGINENRIEALGVNNSRFAQTDNGPFSSPGESLRCRVLYYAPLDPRDMLRILRLSDSAGADRGSTLLRTGARPKWHLGANPDLDPPTDATPSQVNASPTDVVLEEQLNTGPRVALLQDPTDPLVGSGDYWVFAGSVFYRVDAMGHRSPGYYHSGLAQDSWSFAGHADDKQSTGGKNFSDEQLLHWLDVTTLDRDQTPVVVLHIATEAKPYDVIEASVLRIVQRYRSAFAAIGTHAPVFLLVGSYMHYINPNTPDESRVFIENLDAIYLSLAESEPDCAFFSLYRATEGVFFTSDDNGGAGAQQASRDWLDVHGWSTITYGGVTYTLSSADNGGLDGVLTEDGLHLAAPPAAAFYAKLMGDAIAGATCPGDFDADGAVDTRDVIAFLNAWVAGEASADFNGDGAVNTADVLAFLNAWNVVC